MKTSFKSLVKIILIEFIIFSISLITSCSGDDGATGAQGIQGVDGVDGTNGTNGNANVTVKVVPVSAFTLGSPSTSYGIGTVNSYYLSEPLITDDVISKGTVLFFIDRPTWGYFQMPWTFYVSGGDEANFVPQARNGAIFLYTFYRNKTTGALTPYDLFLFSTTNIKYMIILDKTIAGRGISKPDYSKMTYQEICTMFNIPQ